MDGCEQDAIPLGVSRLRTRYYYPVVCHTRAHHPSSGRRPSSHISPVNKDGHLSRSSVAEDADAQVENSEVEESVTLVIEGATESRVLGHGHRVKKGTRGY